MLARLLATTIGCADPIVASPSQTTPVPLHSARSPADQERVDRAKGRWEWDEQSTPLQAHRLFAHWLGMKTIASWRLPDFSRHSKFRTEKQPVCVDSFGGLAVLGDERGLQMIQNDGKVLRWLQRGPSKSCWSYVTWLSAHSLVASNDLGQQTFHDPQRWFTVEGSCVGECVSRSAHTDLFLSWGRFDVGVASRVTVYSATRQRRLLQLPGERGRIISRQRALVTR